MDVSPPILPIDAATVPASPTTPLLPISWREGAYGFALGVATVLCFALSSHGNAPTVIVMAAVALASVISSIAGFAFSAICGAMLFHLAGDRVQIVQIMIVCSIANQAAMVWAIRKTVQWVRLSLFLGGGVVGLPIGISALLYLDRHVYTYALGVFLVIYGGYMLVRRPVILHHPLVALDVLAGFLGGITGGAVGFPGAFVTIWCGFKGWSKEQQRALFQPFILLMQIVALLTISVVRQSSGYVGFNAGDLLCVPPGLLGTALGMLCYRRLSDALFGRAVNILLIISGLSYVL